MRHYNKNRNRSTSNRNTNPITKLIRTLSKSLEIVELKSECSSKSSKSIKNRVDEAIAFSNLKLVSYKIITARTNSAKHQVACCIAAAVMASHLSGHQYARRFYSNEGCGCIKNPKDMYLIKASYESLGNKGLTNAMKKGFAKTILSYDTDTLLRYKRYLIDIVNLIHPDASLSSAKIKIDGSEYNTLSYIMQEERINKGQS